MEKYKDLQVLGECKQRSYNFRILVYEAWYSKFPRLHLLIFFFFKYKSYGGPMPNLDLQDV